MLQDAYHNFVIFFSLVRRQPRDNSPDVARGPRVRSAPSTIRQLYPFMYESRLEMHRNVKCWRENTATVTVHTAVYRDVNGRGVSPIYRW